MEGMENLNTGNIQEDVTERTFTQAEVDKIVKTRLSRAKSESALTDEQIAERVRTEVEARTKELDARACRLDCREYLLSNNYPAELLDALDTSNIEAFKQKADAVCKVFADRAPKAVAPLGSSEPIMTGSADPIAQAFSSSAKHDPKTYPPQFNY